MKLVTALALGISTACCAVVASAEDSSRTITVSITVPDTGWRVKVSEVYQVGDELWAIAVLSRDPAVIAAQMISTASDTVSVTAPDLPVKVYLLGKSWRWPNDEPYTFLASLEEIVSSLRGAKKLYPAG